MRKIHITADVSAEDRPQLDPLCSAVPYIPPKGTVEINGRRYKVANIELEARTREDPMNPELPIKFPVPTPSLDPLEDHPFVTLTLELVKE